MAKPRRYQHFGWPVSPYTAKTRAYLRFKDVPFDDIEPGALKLFMGIKRAVGRAVMPTVQRPDGVWMPGPSEIIDHFEQRHPERSVVPAGPAQRVASLLLELHGDEWLPLVAMHTRWTIGENRRFIADEFGRYSFPHMPGPLRRRLARPVANKMASYLPLLGVTPQTASGIEAFLSSLIKHLDQHLRQHPFLLGTRPCIGDFALYGPLWAHCWRDPGSRKFFEGAPAVVAWFDRLNNPDGKEGAFLANDEVPETLDPIFKVLFEEQWPYVQTLVETIDAWCAKNPQAHRVPRALGNCDFTVGGAAGQRRLLTFTQWMAQRPLEAYANLNESDQKNVEAWLSRFGADGKLSLPINNPFERRQFKMRLKNAPATP